MLVTELWGMHSGTQTSTYNNGTTLSYFAAVVVNSLPMVATSSFPKVDA